jgi:hypothetical protein
MEDRRERKRYSLRLPVHYETKRGDRGSGVVVDISSRSARLQLESRHSLMAEMRLYISWPVKLNKATPLQLRINARVVRTDEQYTVVSFISQEFVTGRRDLSGTTKSSKPGA